MEMAKDTPSDSCRRLALAALLTITHISVQRERTKKPFNPILGETYEYITDKHRFFAE